MADQDKLLSHDSDGIQEYDNDLPKWWIWIFILTIVWSGFYVIWFHFSGRMLPNEQLEAEMAQIAAQQPSPSESAAGLKAAIGNQEAISAGKEIYIAKCLACHGDKGQGLVGPNLADAYWVHGGTPAEIRHTIVEGIPAKGMIAWKAMLKSKEIDQVTAFVVSLKGTDPPGAKAPEGELVK